MWCRISQPHLSKLTERVCTAIKISTSFRTLECKLCWVAFPDHVEEDTTLQFCLKKSQESVLAMIFGELIWCDLQVWMGGVEVFLSLVT
jgi:hypothetical protein